MDATTATGRGGTRQAMTETPLGPEPGPLQAGWRRFAASEHSVGGALYVPSRRGLQALPGLGRRRLPLIVALHGCGQTAGDFAIGTRFAELADQKGFAVLFPESQRTAETVALNPFGCWVWWARANQTRDGEPAKIVALVDRARAAEPRLARRRFCVTGLSSGAAMATILGAVFPDRVSAVASHAGVAFSAAEVDQPSLPKWLGGGGDAAAALAAFNPLNLVNLARWGKSSLAALEKADGAAADHAERIIATRREADADSATVALLVVHGDDDRTVDPGHARQLILQALQVADLLDNGADDGSVRTVASEREEGRGGAGKYPFVRRDYNDRSGRFVARMIRIGQLGHAWSGGSPAGSYTDPEGPDATTLTWQFFRDHGDL